MLSRSRPICLAFLQSAHKIMRIHLAFHTTRWLMGFWSAFFNENERFWPNPAQSPEWNRGAYIAEALAHCGECHTPRNLAFALDNRSQFSGSVYGWYAFN